jgi:quercetin dioxygenase-like cupin family protein
MATPVINSFADIIVKEIAPGFLSKLIHTDSNTVNFIDVAAGSTVPTHHHIHQQMCFVLDGLFELTVDGEPYQITKEQFAIIPSNIPHAGRAITNCRLIDIFSPVREDYKDL